MPAWPQRHPTCSAIQGVPCVHFDTICVTCLAVTLDGGQTVAQAIPRRDCIARQVIAGRTPLTIVDDGIGSANNLVIKFIERDILQETACSGAVAC